MHNSGEIESYQIQNDIRVFGKRVENFPQGVGKVFDELVRMVGGFDRPYYGISYMTPDGQMAYYATAVEKYEGEAEKFSCEKLTIRSGEYLTARLNDWRKKTDCIKDVFDKLVRDERTDKTSPAIEWYKDDDEMLCMIKTVKSSLP